jgi:hypothetical protein
MTDARRNILSVIPLLLIHYRSLVEIGTNYAGTQSEQYMACGILNFDMDPAGRRAIDLIVRDVLRNFNGKRWGQNGPEVLNRVVRALCGTNNVSMVSMKDYLIHKLPFHSLLRLNITRLHSSHTGFLFRFLKLQL